MVLGILTAVGVTFIAGYVARAYQTASANQVREDSDHQRNRIDKLKRRLKELENVRSGSGCCGISSYCFYCSLFLSPWGLSCMSPTSSVLKKT